MVYTELPVQINELFASMQNLPSFRNQSYTSAYNGYMQKMEQINRFYSVKKYRIVFIGEPGKGKTTAICNWINLLRETKLNQKSLTSIPLLATASGRTTVAEVHIRQVETTSQIRIEYMPIKQQEEYIYEYCKYYYNCCHQNDNQYAAEDDSSMDSATIHSEIDRVVRNMASLNQFPKEDTETAAVKRQQILTFMEQFRDLEHFYSYVLKKINLEQRQTERLVYNGNSRYESWLSRQFKDVNNGKNPNCSIARKIYIDVSLHDLDLQLPSEVDEIIDTIGLDSSVRPDLQDLMLAEDTLCFIVDKLENVPSSNVRTLLKSTYLNEWDEYCVAKTSIFVRSPLEELASVNEADGDIEKGCTIKLSELDRRIDVDNIRYHVPNTLFTDACAAYTVTSNRKKVFDPNSGKTSITSESRIAFYDEDIAADYRKEVNDKIHHIIASLQEKLEKDAKLVRAQVKILLDLEQKAAALETHNVLTNMRKDLIRKKVDLLSSFRPETVVPTIIQKAIVDIHWSTIRKMNSLYGAYNLWHTDIYHQIMQAGRECFASAAIPACNDLKEILMDVRDETARSITEGYIRAMEAMVKEQTEQIGRKFLEWALYDKFAPQSEELPFWKIVNLIHGKGYKNAVKANYTAFVSEDTDVLVNLIQESLDYIFNNIIEMFPQSPSINR